MLGPGVGVPEPMPVPFDGPTAAPDDGSEGLVVDCGTCAGRGHACGDCVIMVLLGGPPDGVTLEADEERALGALAEAGLVPPLRHAPGP